MSERLLWEAELKQLIETRRVLGTGFENFKHWLKVRISELEAALGATPTPQDCDNTVSITIRGQEQVAVVMKALHDAGFVVAHAASAEAGAREEGK